MDKMLVVVLDDESRAYEGIKALYDLAQVGVGEDFLAQG